MPVWRVDVGAGVERRRVSRALRVVCEQRERLGEPVAVELLWDAFERQQLQLALQTSALDPPN